MKKRIIATALAAATCLAMAACGSGSDSGSSGADASGDLTVWLQVDAQNLWPKAVEAATTEFNKQFPKVKVTVAYQAWADHLSKFDAAAQGGSAPDVIEMGTTEMGLYMGNGAFADLTGAVLIGLAPLLLGYLIFAALAMLRASAPANRERDD